ncbi:MAG: hypothetical protein ABW136_06680 [Steroidobacteraceae bacterium]
MKHQNHRRAALAATLSFPLLFALTGCGDPPAAHWVQITQGDPCAGGTEAPPADQPPTACDSPVFWLDDANIDIKGGTPYVILQTRYTDGRTGSIRAEANCPRNKLEPTALKETIYKDGAVVANRMITLSAPDEAAVLKQACARR